MESGPFRPLRPFTENDRALFFGREREVSDLAERLASDRPSVMLHGESGIGKTSLVRAGLLPAYKQKSVPVGYIDCARSLDENAIPHGGNGGVLALDNLGYAIDEGPRLERLVALLQRAASVRGLKILFVLDDANLWRLDALERKVGPIAPVASRVRVERFDEQRAADVIERTVLGGGAYFEAGLSHEMALDLAKQGPLSPSMLQLVAGTAVALHVTGIRSYRRSGGVDVMAWRFFDLVVARTGGRPAARALAEVAARDREEAASLHALARAAGVPETEAEALAHALVEEHVLVKVAEGFVLSSEWVRSLARTYTGEARGRGVGARLLLRRKIEGGGLITIGQVREVKRFAGALDAEEEKVVARSVRLGLLALGVGLAIPIVVGGLLYAARGGTVYLDAQPTPGSPVVARLGRPGNALAFLPHTPSFGAVVADSGFARGAFASGVPDQVESLSGGEWMKRLLAALKPLPRGAAALVLDGDVKPLADAYADPAERAAVVQAVGAAGRGAPDELGLLKRALGDPSEDVRRLAIAAAAGLERRAPGAGAELLAAGVKDAAPSVRARALAEIERLPDEQSAPLLAQVSGTTADPLARKRVLEAIGAQVQRTPSAVAALGRAMSGPGQKEATAILSRLVDGSGPSANAAVEALAKVALDAQAPEEARLDALKLLRRRPATLAGIEAIAGSPRLLAAAMPLVVRAKPDEAQAKVAEALRGPPPLRAAAAAAIGLLPRTADTPKLLQTLQADSAPEVRMEAVRALPVLGHEGLKLLAKAAKSGSAEIERAAVETLGAQATRLGAHEAAQLLEQTIKKARSSTRRAAIEALGKLAESKPQAAASVLARLLRDKSAEIRADAAGALGDVLAKGGREAIPALKGATRDPDPATRKRAAASLGRATSSLAGAAARTLAGFAADPEPGVRLEAAGALGALGAAAHESGALAQLVGDRDASVRAAGRKAARSAVEGRGDARSAAPADLDRALWTSFTQAGTPEKIDIAATAGTVGAPQAARAAQADPDAAVRRAAAENAGGLGAANVPGLVSALGDADVAVRVAAVRGLVGARAAAALAQAARNPDLDVRVAALEALGEVGGAAAQGALEAALGDASERVRVAAARGLAPLGPQVAAALEHALADPARDVRDAAVAGLGVAWAQASSAELAVRLSGAADADRRYAAALALARRADGPQAADARKTLDQASVASDPTVRLAARLGRVFAGRPAQMVTFLRLLRNGD